MQFNTYCKYIKKVYDETNFIYSRTHQEAIMKKPFNLYRDIVTGLLFVVGVFGFMSGEFILSTLLFGSASLTSNLDFKDTVQA